MKNFDGIGYFIKTAERRTSVTIGLCILVSLLSPAILRAGGFETLEPLMGNKDAVIVTDPLGRPLFSKNEKQRLIPASTLKILTSLVALHYLGPDYRFPTEFYLDSRANLKIRGYGDPMLISECVEKIAADLGGRLKKIKTIVLDDSYFAKPLSVPGRRSSSYQPYDAPNGALCVNFNTVNFRYENGELISGEPQTPLLPPALKRIKTSGLKSGRLLLTSRRNEATFYAGHLFEFFLSRQDVEIENGIRLGRANKEEDRLIYIYSSGFKLTDVIERLMEYSNNFIANQLLISAGAEAYGPPGTLDKGVRAAQSYSKNLLGIEGIELVEGSGLSRKNRITAKMLEKMLNAFEPYYNLLKSEKGLYYKTGTLRGISTCAGFIEAPKGFYRFVILCNTTGRKADPILNRIVEILD